MVVVASPFAGVRPNRRHVICLEHTAQSIGQKILGEGPDKDVGAVQDRSPQAGRTIQLRPVEHLARGIDAEATIVVTPYSDRVEVLGREPGGVQPFVTSGASR